MPAYRAPKLPKGISDMNPHRFDEPNEAERLSGWALFALVLIVIGTIGAGHAAAKVFGL